MNAFAAFWMALTIRGYVPQRQTLPSMKSMISFSFGAGFFWSSATADMIIPDVQYPHCSASASRNAVCTGCKLIATRRALNGRDLLLRNRAHPVTHDRLRLAVDQDGAGATLAFPTSILAASQIELIRATRSAGWFEVLRQPRRNFR